MQPRTQRKFSGKHGYHKFDIAQGQLETSIRLFLTDGADMFSAITLAAAAGEILHTLVLKSGKQPFVDYVIKVNEYESPETPRNREDQGKEALLADRSTSAVPLTRER